MNTRHSDNSGLKYGYSRKKGDCPEETKELVKAKIRIKVINAGRSEKDIANLLAIADLESGFNPDAKNQISNAKGVFQIIDGTEQDAHSRLKKRPDIIEGYEWQGVYKPFDPDSNIDVAIAIYLDKKRRAGSDDIEKIYEKYNSRPTVPELREIRKLYEKYRKSSSLDPSREPDTDASHIYASLIGRSVEQHTNQKSTASDSISAKVDDWADDDDWGISFSPTV